MNTATEILRHLGGNRFIAMTGAYNLVQGENFLKFQFKKIGHVVITIEKNDTYSVNLFPKRGMVKTKTINDIYADNLINTMEQVTVLRLYLRS